MTLRQRLIRSLGMTPRLATTPKQEAAQARLARMVAENRAKPEIMAYPARREAARRAAQTRRAQA